MSNLILLTSFLKTSILPHIDLYSEECCMYNFSQVYIDHDATSNTNDISDYVLSNEYTTDRKY